MRSKRLSSIPAPWYRDAFAEPDEDDLVAKAPSLGSGAATSLQLFGQG